MVLTLLVRVYGSAVDANSDRTVVGDRRLDEETHLVLPRLVAFVVIKMPGIVSNLVHVRRKRRRNQDQNFSTGFRSGDFGGMCQRTTFLRTYRARDAGAFKNASLSQSTCHAPCKAAYARGRPRRFR